MPTYLNAHPNNLIIGQLILGFIHCMPFGHEYRLQVFQQEFGVTEFAREQWYSEAVHLRTLARLERELGPKTMFTFGKAIAEHAILPPLTSLKQFLLSFDQAYKSNVKGTDLGNYILESYDVEFRQAVVVASTPYPDQFDLGILTEFSRRYKPDESFATIANIDTSKPMRSHGGDTTTYVIRW